MDVFRSLYLLRKMLGQTEDLILIRLVKALSTCSKEIHKHEN